MENNNQSGTSEKLYRWVKASERLPPAEYSKKYISRNVDNQEDVLFGYWNQIPTYYEWLEELPPSIQDKDAEIERLKELIKKAWNKSYDLSRDALEIDGGYYKYETFSAFKTENNL